MDVMQSDPVFEGLRKTWEAEGCPMQPFSHKGWRWQVWVEGGVPVRFQRIGQIDTYKNVKGSFPGG